jgi:hypothetical protein
MNQLYKAIVLEVAYDQFGHNDGGPEVVTRQAFLEVEIAEVLKNSCLKAEARVLTNDLFVEALRIKVDGYFASLQAPRNEYVLVYADSLTEVGSSFSVIKTRYKQRHAADRAAAKLSRLHTMVIAITRAEYAKAARGVVRRNMMAHRATAEERANGYTGWYVEERGTPNYCSPASEAYWSM